MSYDRQIQAAKKTLRRSAQLQPEMFAQYTNWQHALREVERAKEKEREERAKWEQIAGPVEGVE